jgi:hypothetical protein
MRSRAFVLGAIGAGLATIVCFPLALQLAGVVMIALGFTTPFPLMMAAVAAVVAIAAIGIPLAVGLAVWNRQRRFHGTVAAPLGRGLLALGFALAAGPIAFAATSFMAMGDSDRRQAEQARHESRPIVATDSLGFCAPPAYAIEDSQLVVRLVARLPKRDRYEWRASANDRDRRRVFGRVEGDYDAGVETVFVHTRIVEFEADRSVHWPLAVTELAVANLRDPPHQSGLSFALKGPATAPDLWFDHRGGDSLAVVAGPQVPEPARR